MAQPPAAINLARARGARPSARLMGRNWPVGKAAMFDVDGYGPTKPHEDGWSTEGRTCDPDTWNAVVPIGTPVRYYPIAGRPGFELRVTDSEAWELGGHTTVVRLAGRSGGVAVTHVQLVEFPNNGWWSTPPREEQPLWLLRPGETKPVRGVGYLASADIVEDERFRHGVMTEDGCGVAEPWMTGMVWHVRVPERPPALPDGWGTQPTSLA